MSRGIENEMGERAVNDDYKKIRDGREDGRSNSFGKKKGIIGGMEK